MTTLDQLSTALRGDGFRKEIKRTLTIFALNAESGAKINATNRMRVRSGRLRGSIRSEVTDESTGWTVTLSAGDREQVKYAHIQEFGGTIRGRPWLRIPLAPALTGRGGLVDRFAGESLRATGIPWFVFKSRKGDLFIARKGDTLSSGAPRAWYKLVRQVTVRPKTYMTDAFTEQIRALPSEIKSGFTASIRREL